MKTELMVVGKTQNKHFIASINDYFERINHFISFEIRVLPEIKNTKNMTEDVQKSKEAELILKNIQPTDTLVLLDEHGKEFRSIDFASWFDTLQQKCRKIIFLIGGPYGFANEVYQRANNQISLSQMTFSHQVIRLIFVEQLYRACTINKGLPYHHE